MKQMIDSAEPELWLFLNVETVEFQTSMIRDDSKSGENARSTVHKVAGIKQQHRVLMNDEGVSRRRC